MDSSHQRSKGTSSIYIDKSVNHSQNFADPNTLTHTRRRENVDVYEEKEKKSHMSQHFVLLDTHLVEFM